MRKTLFGFAIMLPLIAFGGFGGGSGAQTPQPQPAPATAQAPTAALPAAGPSFDCATAIGEVPRLICADPALSALDMSLARVRANALARVTAADVGAFQAGQEAWRLEFLRCTRAEVPRLCLETMMRERIALLQARYELVPAGPAQAYACHDGSEVVARVYPTDPQTVRLTVAGRSEVLLAAGATVGARYASAEAQFWDKPDGVDLAWFGAVYSCHRPDAPVASPAVESA